MSPGRAWVSWVIAHAADFAMIAVQGLSVLALWLRLRLRPRDEQVHRRYLVVVVHVNADEEENG
jgi:hypothetical protein